MLLSKDRKWPPIVISLHRKKGNQVSDIDLRKIAEYYGITKPKLVRIITGNSWNIELSKLTKGEYDNKMSNAQNDVPSEQSVDTVHIQR